VLPGVPTSVTAGPDSPRGLSILFDVFIGERGRGSFGFRQLPASASTLTGPTPAVLPRFAALLHPFECHRHPSLRFRCPSGYDRKPPPGLTFASVALSREQLGPAPLMGFLLPSAVDSAKDPFIFRGLPHPQPLRPQGSSPLDALIPFTPSRTFPSRAALGIAPFRAFSPPAGPGLVSERRYPLGIA